MTGQNTGHEKTDADVKPIIWFVMALAALLLIVVLLMAVLYNVLENRAEQSRGIPGQEPNVEQIPPRPRLQANPALELADVKDWETERLTTYGWVDKNMGVFRIPIERAMDLVAASGLPYRSSEIEEDSQ
jgi:hypothetical protein